MQQICRCHCKFLSA